jgi:tRNA splicing endonuclease
MKRSRVDDCDASATAAAAASTSAPPHGGGAVSFGSAASSSSAAASAASAGAPSPPSSLRRAPPPPPPAGAPPLLLVLSGGAALVWRPEDCARLRSLGRLSAAPIGQCAARAASRGKSAAVPLALSDEELHVVLHELRWPLQLLDGGSGAAIADCAPLAAPGAGAAVRRAVYADLWRRGYRLTPGLKFGCDYLAYAADASAVHAGFMVIVRAARARGAAIAAADLVARSRVATTALKTCVMAYGDAATGAVAYAAFKRMGPGSAVFAAAGAGGGGRGGGGAGGAPAAAAAAAVAEAADAADEALLDGGGLTFIDPAALMDL